MDSSAAFVVAFVRGRLAPSIRTLPVEDFRRAVETLGSQAITVTGSGVAEVLRRYLEGAVDRSDFCDWIQLLSWGMHPELVKRRVRQQPGGAKLLQKIVQDDRGIAKISIEFEPAEHDTLVDTVQAIEDDCGTLEGPRREVILLHLQALSRRR